MTRGSVPSISSTTPRTLLNRGLGEVNFEKRALGFGAMRNGELVGPFRAVWAQVKLAATPNQTVDVPHALGLVPQFCVLWQIEGPGGAFVHCTAAPSRRDQWTDRAARVEVRMHNGTTLVGSVATFLVGAD